MGLLAGLFSSKAPEKPSGKKEIVVLLGVGNFDVEVVGVGRFQAALETICGRRVPRGVKRYEAALLSLRDKGPQEKPFVRVEIRGRLVGYLRAEGAALFRQQLAARGKPTADGQCQAVIRGGWVSSDGNQGDYEVWLDLPTWS